MNLVNDINDIDALGSKVGIVIGNFDGVHQGHQLMLRDVLNEASSKNEILVLLTFKPHPAEIIKNATSFLINSYVERRTLLEEVGIENIWEIDFNRDFSTLTPTDFLDKYISSIKNINSLYLGHDFAFGAGKKGDHNFVQEYCKDKHYKPFIQNKFEHEGKSVSSSIIRKNLKEGNLKMANSGLGRDFFLTGMVKKGDGRGRTIGFPTANIGVDHKRIIPSSGVYATYVSIKGVKFKAVTNIGTNPTFIDDGTISIETHILDFDNDIYGEELIVSFLYKIRDEKKFSSANDLVEQIKIDIEKRREL
ncbi:MAG: riboflavin biosynthesis protein RibF [Oligoflexia bacterium]|nr:riboflavin biosynthesis protein RibF [Oligoflexia bacterium]